jgi:hypothetical protein
MGWRPSSDEKRAELERALVRAAARMTESDVRNSLWSLATLEWAPMVLGVRESLELALARTLASMDFVEVVDSLWALAKLGWRPTEGGLRQAFALALERALPSLGAPLSLDAPDLARIVWALSKLDWPPVLVGLRSLLAESEAMPSLSGGCDGEPALSSDLEPAPPVAADIDDEARAGIEHEADGECPICFDPLDGTSGCEHAASTAEATPVALATTPCGHLFHADCLAGSMLADRKSARPPSCPMCRGPLHDLTLGDAERSNEDGRDGEWVGSGAAGTGPYDPTLDASMFPNGYCVAANPGPLGMRNMRSRLLGVKGKQPMPRPFACTQELPGGRVSSTGDPMHEWRSGTIRSYNRSMDAYKVRFTQGGEEEWRVFDIDLYGTHGEYTNGKPAGGHWVLLELSSTG